MVPKRLYKFMDPERAEAFFTEGNQSLNLASIHSLNDPFEFATSCSFHKIINNTQEVGQGVAGGSSSGESNQKDIDRILKQLTGHASNVDLVSTKPQAMYSDGSGGYRTPQNIIDNILLKRKVGVLSLSADEAEEKPIIQNPLMWAHYCKSFRGFAIELDPSSDFFKARNDAELCALKKVEYHDEMPPLKDINKLSENEMILKVGIIKSHHWFYEREWRLITTGDEGLKIDAKARLKHLPVAAIKCVYLGIKADEYSNNAITFCRNNGIYVRSMRIRTDDWGLDFYPA